MDGEDEILSIFLAEVEDELSRLHSLLAVDPSDWDMDALYRAVHTIKGASRVVDERLVMTIGHHLEDVLSVLRSDSSITIEENVVAIVHEGARLLEQAFVALSGAGENAELGDYGDRVEAMVEALAQEGPKNSAQTPAAAADLEESPIQTAIGAPQTKTPALDSAQEQAANALPPSQTEARKSAAETVRIGVHKLDELTGLASEMAIHTHAVHGRHQDLGKLLNILNDLRRQHPELAKSNDLQESIRLCQTLRRDIAHDQARSEQSSGRLRDSIRALRMMPFDTLHSVLARVVRDACAVADKEARLSIVGGDTELDRAVLDSLRDPLVHLLRNAVSHGIESPAEREKLGKPKVGDLILQARPSGGHVEVVLQDDGRGLDHEAIRKRCVQRGFLTATEAEEAEGNALTEMIFQPGFSTAARTDELSGRGVGLDVVRTNIENIGGRVEVTSFLGHGATFKLSVPLTRLTTRGVIVRLGKHFFAAPLANVERSLFVDTNALGHVDRGYVYQVDGVPVPVLALESLLRLGSRKENNRPAIILKEGSLRSIFLVDEVLGQREFVLQPLNWNLQGVPGVSATTVIDGGRLVMLLAPRQLLGAQQGVSTTGIRSHDLGQEVARRILVVDDSVTSRTLEKTILGAAGYDITTATDGEEAWGILEREDNISLMVTDVEMPHLDGLGLTRRVRGSGKYKDLPIILVTSLGNPEHKQAGAEAGANAYVVKGSFDQDELLRAVARLI